MTNINNIKTKILASLVIAGLLVVATLFALSFRSERAQGSVMQFSEYQATSTRSTTGTNNIANFTILSSYDVCTLTCPGTVGSVVITGANTGIIRLWDATTTDVTKRAGATSSLTVIEIPASAAAETQTFDVAYRYGILYELVSGTAPTSTITWRPR